MPWNRAKYINLCKYKTYCVCVEGESKLQGLWAYPEMLNAIVCFKLKCIVDICGQSNGSEEMMATTQDSGHLWEKGKGLGLRRDVPGLQLGLWGFL